MRAHLRDWSRVTVLLLLCGFPAASSDVPADTVLVNARVYTVNSSQPWAQALAIRGGKIFAVGSQEEIARFRGPKTRTIDAGQRLVLPGFTDCHNHFLDGSLSLMQVDLEGVTTVAEMQERVKTYAAAHPDLPWILGRGWAYTVFTSGTLPNRQQLDAVVSDRPVYLESFDGHSWWANSKALQAAGISKATIDPSGGTIVRDPATGEPTGAIKEDEADDLIRRAIPLPSHDQIVAALLNGMQEANRVGLVRVISPDGVSMRGGDFHALDLYDELRNQGKLTLRFDIALRIPPPKLTDSDVKSILAARSRFHDDWIGAGKAKFFVDGVIETRTAAMLQPYADDKQSGHLLWQPDEYLRAVTELDRNGIQIFSHAIGDRAIRLALDSYQTAQQANHTKDSRHRIEHIEDAAESDLPRFGQLGVIASFQPLHAYPDDDIFKVWAKNLGPERAQRGWAWRTVKNGGGVLAFGSDWPIVTMNPWAGIQNAVTRQTTDGEPKGGWLPEQRLTLDEAVRGYTLDASFAGHREKSEGSIEPGKLADLIVLSQNLFDISPREITKTEVLLTMVGGKVVYQSPNWNPKSAAEQH
jgi:predicted amidohydrolase YtcJ